MKKIFCIIYAAFFLAFFSCSKDIFDNIKDHAAEEAVYVGKFDKAEAFVGINRLEIDLMNAGRIPQSQINIGKAVQTVYEYDGKTYTCEGVQSWLNITGLTEPKLYRIKVYNVDEYGNKSIPVEVAAIPYTAVDLDALTVPIPQKLLAPTSVQFNWANGLSSNFFDFYEMEYSYTDNGVLHTGKSTDNNSILLLNLVNGSAGTVYLKLKVVPKQNNVPILDTVYLESSISYQLPTIQQYLNARENRKVKQTYIEGTTATITWSEVTEHLVVSEVEYETVSGEFKTMIVPSGTNEIECTDAKAGVKYKTRSGFVPPGAVDTLYKDWVTSKYIFLNFPTGTFDVDPLSYIYFGDTGEPRFEIPQANFSSPRTSTIEAIEEGTYKISDMFGGYYAHYGDDFLRYGIFTFDGKTFTIIEAQMDTWGTGFYRFDDVHYDVATKTLYLTIPWGSAPITEYGFHLILHKK